MPSQSPAAPLAIMIASGTIGAAAINAGSNHCLSTFHICWVIAGVVYTHIIKSANQEKNCTTANCFMVLGIVATNAKNSFKRCASGAFFSFFSALSEAPCSGLNPLYRLYSSGEYSFVLNTVQITVPNNTEAPI